MSADRFQFLEFEEEAADPPASLPEVEPAQREINAQLFSDGTTLAQVRVSDPRGYGVGQEDDDEGLVTLSSLADPTAPALTGLRVVEVFGERGSGTGQFHYPTGLAVDRGGILFVADAHNHRIQRITPGGGVSALGGRGTGRGQFQSPQGVATDDEDSFYIVEQGNHRVQKFTREGVLVLIFGKPGRGEGELSGPTAIAVARGSGDIFLADTGNSRIQRFSADGRFLAVIGGLRANLSSPQALAADAGGSLHVADTFAQRLLRFDPLGRLDRQIGGQTGWGVKAGAVSFTQPRALAADAAGLLYVADGGEPDSITGETRGRIQCLSLADGSLMATVERMGRGLGSLLRPSGLAVGSPAAGGRGLAARGDLYVADTMNHRVLRFVWS